MISSAIWDKSARVNFSKANQIALTLRARVVFEKFTRVDSSQIARETSCDYLFIIQIQKFLCKWMTKKVCSVTYLSESFLKHYGVAKLQNFKALCHALSGAFILIQLHGNELKCVTSIQACNLPSL